MASQVPLKEDWLNIVYSNSDTLYDLAPRLYQLTRLHTGSDQSGISLINSAIHCHSIVWSKKYDQEAYADWCNVHIAVEFYFDINRRPSENLEGIREGFEIFKDLCFYDDLISKFDKEYPSIELFMLNNS